MIIIVSLKFKYGETMYNKELITALKDKKAEFYKKIKAIDETIELLELDNKNGSATSQSTPYDGYDNSWQHAEKIGFFLKREQRFLYNKELATFAHEREPDISIEDFSSKFSAVLSRLKNEKQIVSVQTGKSLRTTVWGSSKWLDDAGNILKEHLPSEEFNIESEKKKLEI